MQDSKKRGNSAFQSTVPCGTGSVLPVLATGDTDKLPGDCNEKQQQGFNCLVVTFIAIYNQYQSYGKIVITSVFSNK